MKKDGVKSPKEGDGKPPKAGDGKSPKAGDAKSPKANGEKKDGASPTAAGEAPKDGEAAEAKEPEKAPRVKLIEIALGVGLEGGRGRPVIVNDVDEGMPGKKKGLRSGPLPHAGTVVLRMNGVDLAPMKERERERAFRKSVREKVKFSCKVGSPLSGDDGLAGWELDGLRVAAAANKGACRGLITEGADKVYYGRKGEVEDVSDKPEKEKAEIKEKLDKAGWVVVSGWELTGIDGKEVEGADEAEKVFGERGEDVMVSFIKRCDVIQRQLEEVMPIMQELFGQVCDYSQVRDGEAAYFKSGRLALLEQLLSHPLITIDIEFPGTDGMTVLMRCCRDGDIPLM